MGLKSVVRLSIALGVVAAISGCTEPVGSFPALIVLPDAKVEPASKVEEPAVAKPEPKVEEPKPKEIEQAEDNLNTGETADQIAMVTDKEKAAAVAKPKSKGAYLGETIGSLGLLDRPGIWVSTPLVKSETQGRVVFKKSGKSANITLIPLGGDAGAGSQVSLGAMQVLGIPLTDLPVLDIYTL